jgi:CPA1 family monovalent cation:H+ antiporter
MDILNTDAILITLAALFSYVNYRFLKIPTTICIMLISLILSLGLLLLHAMGFSQLEQQAERMVRGIDFYETLMDGMLSFLLFAGALHVNLDDLRKQKWVIMSLATVGILTSTFLVGGLSWLIFNGLGIHMPFIYCLVFGALISPTDPIAVLGVLKSVGVKKSLETKIAGESLFNDGIGVVVFLVMVGLATGSEQAEASHISLLLLQEAGGGAVFGLLAGGLTFYLLRSINNYQVEVLLTLALVMGGYAVASALHLSGPIAMVVAGLVIGNHGRILAMSETTRDHLDSFWELVDEVFNAVLFVLIGLEILLLSFRGEYLLATIAIIPAVLLARFISVATPITLLRRYRRFSPRVIEILTWGGLRGGISVALALSLPTGVERDVILFSTYGVVIFSILVQGLTIGRLVTVSVRHSGIN